ncbi:MAG: NAD(P)-dependent oxidoreductase [Chloroflexi bacterium]|nr:NAD(P)-dependent oxidoreductase [Chloroflexota bacterium]
MHIIVTGGAGAIGRHAVHELLSAGHSVTTIDLREPPQCMSGEQFIEGDLTIQSEALRVIRDADVVVHLAAIPNPDSDPPERVLSVNTVSTYNVAEAVRRNGIRRLVYGCSESSSGFGIHYVNIKPQYLPIDETHPVCPHETYSLSKRFGEEIAVWYAQAYGFEAVALRYAWVWLPRDAAGIQALVERHRAGNWQVGSWFGAYIAPQDVAQAVRQACDVPLGCGRLEAFYLTAESTFYPVPTLEVLTAIFGELPEVRDADYFVSNPYATPFDTRKARNMLGFRPAYDWRHYEEWVYATPK